MNVGDQDNQLASRIEQGDEEALRELMALYGTSLLRMAALLLKDRNLAEDVAQETFLQAYRSIAQFKGDGSLYAWLCKIALNNCRARMRKASWKRLLIPGEDSITARNSIYAKEVGDSPETVVLQQELRGIISQLPYKYREVIVLYYFQELNIAEISEQLGEHSGTIKSRLFRGRNISRQLLEEKGWSQ